LIQKEELDEQIFETKFYLRLKLQEFDKGLNNNKINEYILFHLKYYNLKKKKIRKIKEKI